MLAGLLGRVAARQVVADPETSSDQAAGDQQADSIDNDKAR
jgi:hypothetical protein